MNIKKISLIIILFFIASAYLFFEFFKHDYLQVSFLDVGQGDAIYIRGPQGNDIVIDGGPDNLLLSQLSKNMPWWDKKIDYLVISHYHADHMMGFIELLNKYEVKNILVSSHSPDDYLYKIFIQKAEKKGVEISEVQVGQKFVASNNFFWQVLLADDYHEDYNENSIVIKLNYKNNNFLFTGDLGFEGEERLLSLGFDLKSKYIKVGHHGSKGSSSMEFLKAVDPEICIIQSGKDNKFGHPHQETLDRLKEIDCQIKDNQDLGTINFKIK